MLSPLINSTSLVLTSSKKLTTIDKKPHFFDPDFFKPLPTEYGLSCTYPDEFYEAFSQNSTSTQHTEMAMLVLEYMTLQDQARLPLFDGASDRYVKQVIPAIKKILASKDEDHETLTTKIHIMNCASRIGYINRFSGIFKGTTVLNCVSLIGIDLHEACLPKASFCNADLSGINLHGADLTETNLSGANLSGANLSGANLGKSNLNGANLSGANLRGTILAIVDLRNADLRGSDLCNADLRGTMLSQADLRGVNLRTARLSKLNKILFTRTQAALETYEQS